MPRDRQQPAPVPMRRTRGDCLPGPPDRQRGHGPFACLSVWHRARYGERGRETLEKQTTVRGVVVFLGGMETDGRTDETRRIKQTERDRWTDKVTCRRRMSPDKRDSPLTISHLAVGMDDATGLLGGEVVEVGAPVRVRHGPDGAFASPLFGRRLRVCDAAQAQRRAPVGVSGSGGVDLDAVNSWGTGER